MTTDHRYPGESRIPFERITLQWQQYASRKQIPNDVVMLPWLDDIFDELFITMKRHVLQHTLANDSYQSSFAYSDSWVQLLKLALYQLRWFGRRLVVPARVQRRWPVKTKIHTFTVNVERSQIYPEAGFAPEKLGRPVILERVTQDRSWLGVSPL